MAIAMGLGLTAGAWAHEQHGASAATGAASTTVSASACWIRQLPSPAPSGGFLVVHNAGAATAVLQGVQSPDYGMAMMHQTTESNGMSSMSMVHDLKIPAGGDLVFEPGHYHLMLEKPRAGLKVGDTVHMQFALAGGQHFSAACVIKPANAMSSGASDAGAMQMDMSTKPMSAK